MTDSKYSGFTLLVLLAAGLVSGAGVFSGRPLETHEDFVAQTSREMLARGDALVPTFGGEVRLQKPPMSYWAVCGVATVAGERGVPAWVARFPSLIGAMMVAWSAVMLGAVVFDRRTALLSGGIVATSFGLLSYGGNARPEMLYAGLTGVMLVCFLKGSNAWRVEAMDTKASRVLGWTIAAWCAMGLAVLTKGPQLPMLVFLGLSFWIVRHRGVRAWRGATAPLLGVLVLVAVVVPWFALVAMRVDGAAGFWLDQLIGERLGEVGESSGVLHGLWVWFVEFLKPEYLVYAAQETLPWGLVLPVAFFVAWERDRPDLAQGRVLFFAVVVPMLVLSLVPHSRGYYLLPILAPLATLLARGCLDGFAKLAARPGRVAGLSRGLWFLAVIPALVVLGLEAWSHDAWESWIHVAVEYAYGAGLMVLVCAILLGVGALWRHRHGAGWGWRSGVGLGLPMFVVLVSWTWGLSMLPHERSLWSRRDMNVDAFADWVAAEAGGEIEVVTLGFDRDDLIYALNRGVEALPASTTVAELNAMPRCMLVTVSWRLDAFVEEGLVVERGEAREIDEETTAEVVVIGGGG